MGMWGGGGGGGGGGSLQGRRVGGWGGDCETTYKVRVHSGYFRV